MTRKIQNYEMLLDWINESIVPIWLLLQNLLKQKKMSESNPHSSKNMKPTSQYWFE